MTASTLVEVEAPSPREAEASALATARDNAHGIVWEPDDEGHVDVYIADPGNAAEDITHEPVPEARIISVDYEIGAFLHCALCMTEKPPGVSPREYAQLEAGWTTLGFQVWCKRHEVNVLHVDFEGQKHLANTNRRRAPGEVT
ncbi:MAG: hypothetical protein Q8R28_15095 [Dehalococcoidia bacterium]|nr:hypothetical protein [Dehalococcoidia bacterium]